MHRLITLFFLGSVASVLAVDTLEQAKQFHDAGTRGDKDAVVRSVQLLEELVAREPQNQLARVWLGSAYTLRSRDMGLDPARLDTLRKGGATMDEAVSAAPNDPAVRIVRAMNSYHLPAVFGRKKVAREDFLFLLRVIDEEDSVPRSERQLVYYYGGRVLNETGDRAGAQAAWRKGLALDGDSAIAVKLKRLIR